MKAFMHASGLVALGIVSRLLPHPPNMTAIGAIALESRARFGPIGLLIPIASMLVADAILGFYDWRLLLSVYASFALVGMLGSLLARFRTAGAVAGAAAFGSMIFFLVTNTFVWALSSWYPHTLEGLLACFIAGIPFALAMFIGDQLFSFALLRDVRAPLPFVARSSVRISR